MSETGKTPVVSAAAKPKRLSIKDGARYLAMNEVYLRALIRKGTIKSEREPVDGSDSLWRHMILIADLDAYKAGKGTHSRRIDGRGKFVIYLTTDELDKIHQFMPALPIEKANNTEQARKNYAKQKARKAAKKGTKPTVTLVEQLKS